MGNSNNSKQKTSSRSVSPIPNETKKDNKPLEQATKRPKEKNEPIPSDQSILNKSGIQIQKKRVPKRRKSMPSLKPNQLASQQESDPYDYSLTNKKIPLAYKYSSDNPTGYNRMPKPESKTVKALIYINTVKPIKVSILDSTVHDANWLRDKFFEKIKQKKIAFSPQSRFLSIPDFLCFETTNRHTYMDLVLSKGSEPIGPVQGGVLTLCPLIKDERYINRPDNLQLDQFDLITKLGKGGFSIVYLGMPF